MSRCDKTAVAASATSFFFFLVIFFSYAKDYIIIATPKNGHDRDGRGGMRAQLEPLEVCFFFILFFTILVLMSI